MMTPGNVFFFLIGVLTVIAVIAGIIFWKPASNPFLFGNWYQEPKAAQVDTNPAQNPIVQSVPEKTAGAVWEKDHYVYIVKYNGKTFSPKILIVDRGNSVRFQNTGTPTMRLQIDLTNVEKTTTYTQPNTVPKGGTYELSFSDVGIWSAMNLNGDPDINAVIYVR